MPLNWDGGWGASAPSKKNNENSGKIELKIERAKEDGSYSSEVKNIGGFKWRLEVRSAAKKLDEEPNLHFFDARLFCELGNNNSTPEAFEKLWFCKATIKMQPPAFSNVNAPKRDGRYFFFNGHNCHHWMLRLVGRDDLDKVTVDVEITVNRHNLRTSLPMLDTDLLMKFNGKEERVAVNKHALASISTYFDNLFFRKWSETAEGGEKDKFGMNEDEDFDLPAFKLMLYSAMAMGWMVHKGKFLRAPTALAILKLSIKYDVPMLLDYCQEYLMAASSTDCPKMELLEVAEQLGLLQLKDHCLAAIIPADLTENYVHNYEIFSRLSKHTQQLLVAHLDENGKEVRQRKDQWAYGHWGGWGNSGFRE